jgi:hypothetical protein
MPESAEPIEAASIAEPPDCRLPPMTAVVPDACDVDAPGDVGAPPQATDKTATARLVTRKEKWRARVERVQVSMGRDQATDVPLLFL